MSAPKIHPSATVHPEAVLAPGITVGPWVQIEADVEIGEGAEVLAGTILHPGTRIGSRCRLGPYAVIGGVPMDYDFAGEESFAVLWKVPARGELRLIGAMVPSALRLMLPRVLISPKACLFSEIRAPSEMPLRR